MSPVLSAPCGIKDLVDENELFTTWGRMSGNLTLPSLRDVESEIAERSRELNLLRSLRTILRRKECDDITATYFSRLRHREQERVDDAR